MYYCCYFVCFLRIDKIYFQIASTFAIRHAFYTADPFLGTNSDQRCLRQTKLPFGAYIKTVISTDSIFCVSLNWTAVFAVLPEVSGVYLSVSQLHQLRIWPHPHYSSCSALATSNTPHSVQKFSYLLQFHLWHTPLSISDFPQPYTKDSKLHSSKIITIPIRHPNLCHPSCNHVLVCPPVGNHWPQTLRHSDSSSSFNRVRACVRACVRGCVCVKRSALQHLYNSFSFSCYCYYYVTT